MAMEMISIEHHGRVAVLKLTRSVINPLNLQMIRELMEALERIARDAEVRGLVIASSNEKFFSIGFDIPHLFGLERKDFSLFYRTFNQACLKLYTLPKPTVAAIAGHAIAGGCILALCCDYRIIAEGRKLMGLNEIKLGVPVPYLTDCILQQLVGLRYAREVLDTGEFYAPRALLNMGIVDQVVLLEEVLPASIKKAEQIGSFSPGAFEVIKRNRVDPVKAQVLAHQEEKEENFIDLWYSDEARARLQEAMEKF